MNDDFRQLQLSAVSIISLLGANSALLTSVLQWRAFRR